MERRKFFPDGRTVSELCLGTMMFGDQADETVSRRILDRYFEAGGNFVDTADAYAGQESEKILGRLLKDRPEDLTLATKVGNPVAGVEGSGGLSAKWIARAAEMSRERLGAEAIDLYYLHLDDASVPLEEIIGALGELLSKGTIRNWGFSNFRPWKIAELVRVADSLGVARPVAAQPYYHVLNRIVETDYLPACRHFGISVVSYSPLARGILTGKYRGGQTPAGSRADRADKRMLEAEFLPDTLARAAEAADYAEGRGADPSALALKWVLANTDIASVLIGPKSVEQLEGYLAGLEAEYGPKDEAFLSALCTTGHVATPGHNDPRYPLEGRILPAALRG